MKVKDQNYNIHVYVVNSIHNRKLQWTKKLQVYMDHFGEHIKNDLTIMNMHVDKKFKFQYIKIY